MSYKKVILESFGGPEVLEVIEVPNLPEPGPDEVRVKIQAASATFTDTMVRTHGLGNGWNSLPLKT